MSFKSLAQPTPRSVFSSAARFTSFGPALLNFLRLMIRFLFTGIFLIACGLTHAAEAQDSDIWHQRQSGAFLSDCCFGANQFVVVGDAGTIQNSSDGTNWITHKLGNNLFFHGVAYGAGRYVAVGAEQVLLGG